MGMFTTATMKKLDLNGTEGFLKNWFLNISILCLYFL